MSTPAWPADLRKRLRAARGYAGMSLDELASKTGLGRQTIFRMESGERGPQRIKEMELREIARVCGLPYGFFGVDWGRLEDANPSVHERLDDVCDTLDAIRVELNAVLAGQGISSPPGEARDTLHTTGTRGGGR